MENVAQPAAVAASVGIQNIKEVVIAGMKTFGAIKEAKVNDGKIDLKDAGLLLPLVDDYIKAIDGIGNVVPEGRDLSSEEMAELVALVAADLGSDPALQNKVTKVLLALKANYEAVKALI